MEKVEELNIFQVKKYDDIFYIVDQIKGYRVWILVKWKVTLICLICKNTLPVQAASEGFVRQLFTVANSVVSVVHVVPSHFPASTLGRDVEPV